MSWKTFGLRSWNSWKQFRASCKRPIIFSWHMVEKRRDSVEVHVYIFSHVAIEFVYLYTSNITWLTWFIVNFSSSHEMTETRSEMVSKLLVHLVKNIPKIKWKRPYKNIEKVAKKTAVDLESIWKKQRLDLAFNEGSTVILLISSIYL